MGRVEGVQKETAKKIIKRYNLGRRLQETSIQCNLDEELNREKDNQIILSLLKDKENLETKQQIGTNNMLRMQMQMDELNSRYRQVNEKYRDTIVGLRRMTFQQESAHNEYQQLRKQNQLLERKLGDSQHGLNEVMGKMDRFQKKLNTSEGEKRQLLKEIKKITNRIRKVQMDSIQQL